MHGNAGVTTVVGAGKIDLSQSDMLYILTRLSSNRPCSRAGTARISLHLAAKTLLTSSTSSAAKLLLLSDPRMTLILLRLD